jgi:hypothetical protein
VSARKDRCGPNLGAQVNQIRVSGQEWREEADGYTGSNSYLVVFTLLEGKTEVFEKGRYLGWVVKTAEGQRFKEKRCIYDTLKIQTLAARSGCGWTGSIESGPNRSTGASSEEGIDT